MSLYRGTAWGPAVVLSLLAFDYACGGGANTTFGQGAAGNGSGASGNTSGNGASGNGATSGNGTASGNATASGNGNASGSGSAGGSGNASSGSSSGGGSGSVATSGAGSGGGSGTAQGGTDAGKIDSSTVGAGGGFLGMPFKGVAFAEAGTPCSDLTTLNLSWFYNWGASTNCKAGPPYVPMVWGDWTKLTFVVPPTKVAAAGFNIVLGFNEPDNAGQSNMTVAQAIALWPQMLQPTFTRVGGPATSSAPTGMTWQDNFIAAAAAASLRVDFVNVHWYGIGAPSCSNVNLLDAYITWAEHFNKPVWLTEFSCDSQTAAVDKAFYDAAIIMFAKHKLLERYAWFETRSTGVFANATLIDPTGALTPLGQDYAAAPAIH